MVIIKPFKVLVCLAIISLMFIAPASQVLANPDLSGGVGLQGEALSADPGVQALPPLGSTPSQPFGNPRPQSYSQRSYRPQVYNPSPSLTYNPQAYDTAPPMTYNFGAEPEPWPAMPAAGAAPVVCPPEGCSPQPYQGGSLLPPLFGLFSPPGLAFGDCRPSPYLFRIGCKQFNLNAKLWKAKLNASTIKWGTDYWAAGGTELDLHDDLGLPKYKWIPEYEARCQIRPNWGIRFSYTPIHYRSNAWSPNGFFFGNTYYFPYWPFLTVWHRNIYKWDLVYDWYQRSHAVSSIFAGYALYDDKFTISQNLYPPGGFVWVQRRTRSSGWGLALAGISMERAIRVVGGGVASGGCKWTVQFCEGYFGWDGYAAVRIAVPMDCGRFGYLECGWKWVALQRDYPTNTDKTNWDGLIGAAGLVF